MKRPVFIDNDGNLLSMRREAEQTLTGVCHGGSVTKGSGNLDLHVDLGSGVIVDSTTNPCIPVVTDVAWLEQTIVVTPTATDTQEVHHIYIDQLGILYTIPIQDDTGDNYTNVKLGWLELSQNVIVSVVASPQVIGQTATNLIDIFKHLNSSALTHGLRVMPSTGLSVFVESGGMIIPGVNWETDKHNPNILSVPQTGNTVAPVTLAIFDRHAKSVMAAQTTLPKQYDNGTSIEHLTGDETVIHYLFFSAAGFSLQLGDTAYPNFRTAFVNGCSNKDNFAFAAGANTAAHSILLAQIVLSNRAVDFSDKSLIAIVSTINNESGNTVSPIDLTLVPQYLLNVEAAEDLSVGDPLSMDINGHLQKYPATGGEGYNEYTTDEVDMNEGIFLAAATNQGLIAWRSVANTSNLRIRTAQGNSDGTMSLSPILDISNGSEIRGFHLCRIDDTRAGFVFIDSSGVVVGVVQSNGINDAPTIGSAVIYDSNASITDADICWISNNSHLAAVWANAGTVYNRYSEISGNSISSTPKESQSHLSATYCRCESEGNNLIVVGVNSSNQSVWREAAFASGWFSSEQYDDFTDTETVSNCDRLCGMQVQSGNILAQFYHNGDLTTYQATYSSGSSMATPTQYGAVLRGEDGDLIKTASGIGYSVTLTTDGYFEIYEGTISGEYQKVYTSTICCGIPPNSVKAIMFGSVFAFNVLNDYTWARRAIMFDSSATRTDHFIAVCQQAVGAGTRFSADLALPLITLQRDYPVGTTYEYGPYKYQLVAHNQAVIILEATTMI